MLNELAAEIYANAKAHGFWDGDRNMGEMLMLGVSELAEALEEHRDGRPTVYYSHAASCAIIDYKLYQKPIDISAHHDDMPDGVCIHGATRGNCVIAYSLPRCSCDAKPEGTAVELADCIIRCLDTLYSLDVDIDAIIKEKMRYNETRPIKHGKAY